MDGRVGLWLFDRDMALTASLMEFESIITTTCFGGDWSSFTAKLPESAYEAVRDAYFAIVADEPTVYLVETLTLSTGPDDAYLTCGGRDALALLDTRTIEGGTVYTEQTPGAILYDQMLGLVAEREIPNLVFGDGETLGAPVTMTTAWGQLGQTMLDLTSSATLGMRSYASKTDIRVEIYEPVADAALVGEPYGNSNGESVTRDVKDWRNYAVVTGTDSEGAPVRIDVDWTGGEERREMYVQSTASTLEAGTTPDQCMSTLAPYGAAALANHRRVEYAVASTTAPMRCGDVAWYDSGRWRAPLMVTEATTVHEGGTVTYGAVFGEPSPGITQAIRRLVKW